VTNPVDLHSFYCTCRVYIKIIFLQSQLTAANTSHFFFGRYLVRIFGPNIDHPKFSRGFPQSLQACFSVVTQAQPLPNVSAWWLRHNHYQIIHIHPTIRRYVVWNTASL